jgi:tetratricopeptide (TPR) repeat protein
MARIHRRNLLYRMIWSIGHTPLRFVEFIQFGLLSWVLIEALMGFGGYLAYGEPMVGVSKTLLVLVGVHAIMLVFRGHRPGIDWILLVPAPFLAYTWIHFRFITPTPWEGGAVFAVYLQAYVLFLIVYNSIHSPRSAKWMVVLLQIPILVGLVVAYLHFYVFPDWVQSPDRIMNPEYRHGISGFLHDSTNLGFFLIGVLPLCMVFIVKHFRQGPGWIYYTGLSVCLIFSILMSANPWGLLVMGLMLLGVPIFMSEEWRKRLKAWKLMMILFPVGVFLSWFVLAAIRDRLMYLLSDSGDSIGSASREIAWRAFVDNPIFGNGLGSFGAIWDQYAAAGTPGTSRYAVGSLSDLLAEMGLLGLILFLPVVVSLTYVVFQAWRDVPYIRLNKEVAGRLQNFPPKHPLHKRLKREKGKMPTRKAVLGGLFLGSFGMLAYTLFDYALKLPVALFFTACLAGAAAAFARGYRGETAKGRWWIVAVLLPILLSLWATYVGSPRFYANYLTTVGSEELSPLLAEPDRIFQDQGDLYHAIAMLEQAVDLLPNHGEALATLGTAKLAVLVARLDSPEAVGEKAMPVLERAVEVFPDSWEVHFNMARGLMLTSGSSERVEDHLRQATALAPARLEPAAALGSFLILGSPRSKEGRDLLEAVAQSEVVYAPARDMLRRLESARSVGELSAGSILNAVALAEEFQVLPDLPNRINGAGILKASLPVEEEADN